MKPTRPIVYVTRDAERASSMEQGENYAIVTNEKGETILDTYELLQTKRLEELMKEKKDAAIVVFQNTARIEKLCEEKKWKLLNPPAEFSKKIEEKISQVKWLGDLARFLPSHKIHMVKDVWFDGTKFVLQFNHSHTGGGTHVIDTEAKLEELKEKFPNRECRVSDFIDGPVFTLNVVVAKNTTVTGNISYQITGLADFTDNPFSTVGNDWKLPYTILSEKERGKILEMARALGARLSSEHWLGLFGIDVILDEKSRQIYLLEINARQPAGTTCESILQKSAGAGMTIFEAHIAALLGKDLGEVQKISDGAQIVLRIKASVARNIFLENSLRSNILEKYSVPARLHEDGFTVTTYKNTKPNAELLRIRSDKGIMKSHGKLNDIGEKISSIISKQ